MGQHLSLLLQPVKSSSGQTDEAPSTTDRLPIIDLTGYLNPKSPEDKARVIAEVREACSQWGFFQIKAHGVPKDSQEALFKAIQAVMGLPQEDKDKLSFLNNAHRRGYEKSGDSVRVGDALPDAKEVSCVTVGIV